MPDNFDYIVLVQLANSNVYIRVYEVTTWEFAYKLAHQAFNHANIQGAQVIHIHPDHTWSLLLDLVDESDYDPDGIMPFYAPVSFDGV